MFSGLDREHRIYDMRDLAVRGRRGAAGRRRRSAAPTRGPGPAAASAARPARGEAHGSGGAAAHPAPDTDQTLQHPRCVFQILKRHFARYTPGDGGARSPGCPQEQFRQVCELVTENSGRDRTTAFVYSLGWTQHTVGVQYIRTAAILQALLGNIGRPGGGILALRGHASIQGSTDIPTLFDLLPGYLPCRTRTATRTCDTYVEAEKADKGFWANTRRLHGQPAEGVVGRRGHGGQRLLLRLPAPADRQPQHLRDRAGPAGRGVHRATSCSARTRRSARPTRGCSGWAWPTWTGWWCGTSR